MPTILVRCEPSFANDKRVTFERSNFQTTGKKFPAERIIRELHFLLFPEEYDQQSDSIADAAERRAG